MLLSEAKEELIRLTKEIGTFLKDKLNLKLHPKRRRLQLISDGIDFLGYIVRRNYILVRRRVINNMKTRLRYFDNKIAFSKKKAKINTKTVEDMRDSIQSYLGHLKWANSYNLVKRLATKKVISNYFKIKFRYHPKKKIIEWKLFHR